MLGRPEPVRRPVEQQFWYRSTKFVMRRAVPIGLAVVALLMLLGAPFLGVRWGFPDDRVLPKSASAHQVGDQLRSDFANNSATAVTVVIPDSNGLRPTTLSDTRPICPSCPTSRRCRLQRARSSPGTGRTTVSGDRRSAGQHVPHRRAARRRSSPTVRRLSSTACTRCQARAAGRSSMTGTAQINRDSVDAITSRLPLVLGLIAVIMFVLLFLLTGSVVLPAESSGAQRAFADSRVRRDGVDIPGRASGCTRDDIHRDTGRQHAGAAVLHRVRLVHGLRGLPGVPDPGVLADVAATRADNDESVALGVARTGRVVTAAALVMSISFAALIAAHVSFMRMFGLGLTLAVLVDATLVRMVLVPAFMHVMGKWNWWAPGWLVWLHERFGLQRRSRCSATSEPTNRGGRTSRVPSTAR